MEDELNEREREALAALPRDIEPKAELRGQVATELHRNGLLRRRPGTLTLAIAAALIAGFLGGLLLPRATRLVTHQREFILFIHDTPYMRVDGKEAQRVEEYRRWAQQLRARGTLIEGEKLTDEVSGAGSYPTPNSIGGFFRIVARDRAEAEAVARTCPHVRHGGWIEVREIDHV